MCRLQKNIVTDSTKQIWWNQYSKTIEKHINELFYLVNYI